MNKDQLQGNWKELKDLVGNNERDILNATDSGRLLRQIEDNITLVYDGYNIGNYYGKDIGSILELIQRLLIKITL